MEGQPSSSRRQRGRRKPGGLHLRWRPEGRGLLLLRRRRRLRQLRLRRRLQLPLGAAKITTPMIAAAAAAAAVAEAEAVAVAAVAVAVAVVVAAAAKLFPHRQSLTEKEGDQADSDQRGKRLTDCLRRVKRAIAWPLRCLLVADRQVHADSQSPTSYSFSSFLR
jgi:hypothetical protein